MTQSHRNKLYDLACSLDNHARVRIPEKVVVTLAEVPPDLLIRLRFQSRLKGVYAVYREAELSELADRIRSIVAYDESRLTR